MRGTRRGITVFERRCVEVCWAHWTGDESGGTTGKTTQGGRISLASKLVEKRARGIATVAVVNVEGCLDEVREFREGEWRVVGRHRHERGRGLGGSILSFRGAHFMDHSKTKNDLVRSRRQDVRRSRRKTLTGRALACSSKLACDASSA